jgi:hypothetical protein
LKLRADQKEFGFVFNEYDPCVANKMVNGTQMTVVFHVDDLKVSHASDFQLTKMVVWLGKNMERRLLCTEEMCMIIWEWT